MSPDQVVATLAAFLIAIGAPIALRPMLKRAGVIDVPNERSSHDTPVLRGGGLAQACAMVLAIGYSGFTAAGHRQTLLFVVGATCLAAATLGWLEDLHGLPVKIRAGAQVLIGIAATSAAALTTGHSAWWGLVGGIALVGGINVVNFMDGVNMISALHGIVAGLSFVAIGLLENSDWLVTSGSVLAAAFAAFLPWNINGQMFLGDVGSYLLGGAFAIIVTVGWMEGLPIIALAAPMTIYVADTAVTLMSRIRAGEQWRDAHRDHTYQRMNQAGLSHITVACAVVSLSIVCAALGIGASEARGRPFAIQILAILLIAGGYTTLRYVVKPRIQTRPLKGDSSR